MTETTLAAPPATHYVGHVERDPHGHLWAVLYCQERILAREQVRTLRRGKRRVAGMVLSAADIATHAHNQSQLSRKYTRRQRTLADTKCRLAGTVYARRTPHRDPAVGSHRLWIAGALTISRAIATHDKWHLFAPAIHKVCADLKTQLINSKPGNHRQVRQERRTGATESANSGRANWAG